MLTCPTCLGLPGLACFVGSLVPPPPLSSIKGHCGGALEQTYHCHPYPSGCPVDLHKLISPDSVCWSSQLKQSTTKPSGEVGRSESPRAAHLAGLSVCPIMALSTVRVKEEIHTQYKEPPTCIETMPSPGYDRGKAQQTLMAKKESNTPPPSM